MASPDRDQVFGVPLLRQFGCGKHTKKKNQKQKSELITIQATRPTKVGLGRRYAAPVLSTLGAGENMSNNENIVECEKHGSCTATFVCRHLTKGESLGFNVGYSEEDPDCLYPDAWCDECDSVLETEDEWNEKSERFADIKLICSSCYMASRERNWVRGKNELNELISSGFGYLSEAQKRFMEDYKIGEHERWDWYQEDGKLVFSNNGAPIVEAEIDFVGSISNSSNTWMWAWANTSYLERAKSESRRIRELGDESNIMQLASAIWPATEVDGWEMTAIMAKNLNAIGAYRTPSDSGFVYMIVRQARWLTPI